MKRSIDYIRLLNNILILLDFVILNILFFIYMQYDGRVMHLSNNVDAHKLYFAMNAGMVVGQYFFSNIIHKRQVRSDLIIRQVMLLVITTIFAEFILIKFVCVLYDVEAPLALFLPYFAPILYVGVLLSRIIERNIIKNFRKLGRNSSSILFIGCDNALVNIYRQMANDLTLGYNIQGYYADNKIQADDTDKFVFKGNLEDLTILINNNDNSLNVDAIYCSLYDEQHELIYAIMRYCDKKVIRFYYVPPFTHTFGFTLKVGHIGDSIVFSNYETPLENIFNRMQKRTFDIIVSSFVCFLLLFIIPIIALIIKLQSPGPIFFKQIRTGLRGNNFTCYKFRSMHVNKDANRIQATEHDPRKFTFGDIMRKSNIDELPQFFCVLKGDMSIVGPRPHMLYHTEIYSELIDKYMVRHFVKPGITGWAQVTGYRGETKELWQMEGRVRKDIWYIEHWTFWLDIAIMFKTAKQILIHDKHAY